MNPLRDFFGDDRDRPPAPEVATPEDIEEYNRRYLVANDRVPDTDPDEPGAMADSPYQKDTPDTAVHREQYPWLFGERRGIRWDFDPIELRNLAQPNTWVGMMVQSIVTQIAETPFTVVKNDGNAVETQKRLETHPDERTESHVLKDLPDRTAEEIYDLLRDPNPDDNWQDMVEMWFADLPNDEGVHVDGVRRRRRGVHGRPAERQAGRAQADAAGGLDQRDGRPDGPAHGVLAVRPAERARERGEPTER